MTTDFRINCRQARSELALWAGGDLDDESALPLERHLAACPECRGFREELAATQKVLRAAGESLPRTHTRAHTAASEGRSRQRGAVGPAAGVRPAAAVRSAAGVNPAGGLSGREGESWDSLWPGLCSQLDARDRALRAPRFNGWAPFVAVTAACLLVAVVSSRNNFVDRGQPVEINAKSWVRGLPDFSPKSPAIVPRSPDGRTFERDDEFDAVPRSPMDELLQQRRTLYRLHGPFMP